MKWHFNFFRFAVMCAAFVALAGFMACSDDDSESGSELVLSASTSSLAGGGSVTFTVAFEDRDVTAEAVIKNVTSGSEVRMPLGRRMWQVPMSSRPHTMACCRTSFR